jgi:AAA+ ATPase superfamily predicted ATPase
VGGKDTEEGERNRTILNEFDDFWEKDMGWKEWIGKEIDILIC